MPLPPAAAAREPIHTRQVLCQGYRRTDGMWDIEGHLVDTKTYAFDTQYRGHVPTGEPVHDMWLRITVDDELVIRAAVAVMDRNPFPICPGATANFDRLVGLSIRPGFHLKVREMLGGTAGCTHLVELLGPLATTAFQTIYPYRERLRRERGEPPAAGRPRLIDTCHGWSARGEVVKRLYPDFYQG